MSTFGERYKQLDPASRPDTFTLWVDACGIAHVVDFVSCGMGEMVDTICETEVLGYTVQKGLPTCLMCLSMMW